MANHDELDKFFAILEDQDAEFEDGSDQEGVPVLTYRWCRNEDVANCAVQTLVDAGLQSMKELGLQRLVCKGQHLRGDTETGQRVKMTVVRSKLRTMYLLMTAGMPGTRNQAKEINARLARRIEELARESKENR